MIELLAGYIHAMSLALWFGGLFVYVMIVWPQVLRTSDTDLPRTLLVGIGARTAPWIYLAMFSALASFLIFWLSTEKDLPIWAGGIYFMVLLALIANNLYGSFFSWPAIMMAPDRVAQSAWENFYIRMATSMVVGLTALSVTLFII